MEIRRWLYRLLPGLFGVALLVLFLRRADVAVPVEDYHMAMGTVVRVALFVEPERAPPLFQLARAEIDRLDSALTRFGGASEVALLGERAAREAVLVSADLAGVLGPSLELAQRSGGAFDPSLGALTELWGFPEAVQPPAQARIDSARALCGYRQVSLDGGRVSFARPGLRLDLGGSAKGYIVDRAVAALQAAGVEAGVVEAGGDLRYWGVKPDGRPWRFGVQHPRDPERVVAVDDLGLAALATSGDYEQYFEYEGRRYHHLLDPVTGYPARPAVSATVWARTALEADALATATFVAGPQRALALAAEMDSVEVLLYYEADDGTLARVASAGLQGRLETASDPQARDTASPIPSGSPDGRQSERP